MSPLNVKLSPQLFVWSLFLLLLVEGFGREPLAHAMHSSS